MASVPMHRAGIAEADRRQGLVRCRDRLSREGFTVSVHAGPRRARSADLLASMGDRTVRVLVLTEAEVDAPETRARVRASLREGETRLAVPWPLRWRAFANLARWRLDGASVLGW